jgi:hypothetical protein
MLRKLLKYFWQLLTFREYVVGDELPKHLNFSHLKSREVFFATRCYKILELLKK